MTGFDANLNENTVAIISEFCSSRDLKTLSCTSVWMHRSVLNAAIAIYCDQFGVKIDHPDTVLPRSRSELFRLVDRVRSRHDPLVVSDVFLFACASGYADFVRKVLQETESASKALLLSSYASDGSPPLVLAAMNGHGCILATMLAHGVYVDQSDKRGKSALWHACNSGHSEVVIMLLDVGASVSASSHSTLLAAVLGRSGSTVGKCVCITAVTNRFAQDLDAQMVQSKIDPFNQATISESGDMILALINAINTLIGSQRSGSADLLVALLKPFKGQPDVTAFIRSFTMGPLVKAIDSPIVVAVSTKQHVLVQPLLESGLCLTSDCAHQSGKSPLYIASESGHIDCVKLLLSFNASLSQLTSSNRNCVHAAVERDNREVVDILCHHASVSDITQLNSSDISPLTLAENRGRVKMVVAMLRCYQRTVTSANVSPYMNKLMMKYNRHMSNPTRTSPAKRVPRRM